LLLKKIFGYSIEIIGLTKILTVHFSQYGTFGCIESLGVCYPWIFIVFICWKLLFVTPNQSNGVKCL
jgi:hypothetical protein